MRCANEVVETSAKSCCACPPSTFFNFSLYGSEHRLSTIYDEHILVLALSNVQDDAPSHVYMKMEIYPCPRTVPGRREHLR